ncbi:hypothetical protein PsorP6_007452 [Peronosclerospora sorghi]|uniref:Uncharacterized protein n=1 Tax=Peronosclerospora sorghi TaxID=230839 RepID=A0ACC0W742_9STRA|nr:hypothetical protein PsorP6_007452 [Peronosclerospora sorghi]
MTRQGYLILHDKLSRPSICYFSLEDGFLRQYESDQCSQCLREVQLSGCKISVKAQKRANGVPSSFYLEIRKVLVKDLSYALGRAERLEFSACSSEDRQEWRKALFSWQRYYWRDPLTALPEKKMVTNETHVQLEQIIAKYYVHTSSNGHLISFAAAKQPISFLRRNVHSLHRSLSLTMRSTPKSPSDTEQTDCVKAKLALPYVDECLEATISNNICHVAARTPHYLPECFVHGNNQEAH